MQLRRALLLTFAALLFFPAVGLDVPTTRYVKASCTNGISTYEPTGNTCTGGSALVYNTIQHAIDVLVGGDTVDIRVGTYVEAPVLSSAAAGVAGAPTAIQGHTGELVTIQPTSANGGGTAFWNYANYSLITNVTIDGANMTGTTNLVLFGEGSGTVYHHISITNSTVMNHHGQGAACLTSSGGASTSFHDFLYANLIVHDCGIGTTTINPGTHGLYIPGVNHIITHNEIYNCFTEGIQLYSGGSGPSGTTISYNRIHDTGAPGILVQVDRTAAIYGNIVYHTSTDTAHYGTLGGIYVNVSGPVLYQNTVYNNTGYGIWFTSASTSATIAKNNILNGNSVGDFLDQGSTAATMATNKCANTSGTRCTSGAVNFIDAANADFNLGSGSTAIDFGTDLTSVCPAGMNCSFNGSAPDAGALEGPTKNNFSVNGATVTFTWNNAFAPIVVVANPTCRLNTGGGPVSDVITSCAAPSAGSNTFTCTLTTAAINTDIVDCSVAAGAVQSSVLVGNLAASTGRASNLALTNSAVTNLTSAAAATLTQTHQQIYQLVGPANTALALLAFTGGSAEDSNATLPSPSAFRVRTAVEDTVAAAPAGGLECWASEAGGAYAQIPASVNGVCGVGVHLCMSPIPNLANFAVTTKRQTSALTFKAGAVVQNQSSTPNVAWATNSETEQECAVQIASGVAGATTFDFRMRRAGGAVLDAYSVTVRVTVGGPFGLLMSGAK